MNPEDLALARYDYRGLGQMLKRKLADHGLDLSTCCGEIGVSSSDLSLIMAGQPIPAARVIAVCDWLKVSFRAFYAPAPRTLAMREQPETFRANNTETERTSHHG